MPALKNIPDRLVRTTTKRDGKEGLVVVAEGTPLARLQSIHDDADMGVLAGDLNDVLAQCEPKDETVVRLTKLAGKQKKGDRVQVETKDVVRLTAILLGQ